MRTALLVILAFSLTACGTPLVRYPDPTPGVVFLLYPAYLQPSVDRFSECAYQRPDLSLFTIPHPAEQPDLPGARLQLQLGGEIPKGSAAYQIGEETIAFIVHPDNPTNQLSTEELLAIYTGQQDRWDYGARPEIQLLSYPEDDPLRSWLETRLPGNPLISSQARIAPNPQAILQEVLVNSKTIGYLPVSWLDSFGDEPHEQVKVVLLESSLAENLVQPILVLSSVPLAQEVHALIACLQQPED